MALSTSKSGFEAKTTPALRELTLTAVKLLHSPAVQLMPHKKKQSDKN